MPTQQYRVRDGQQLPHLGEVLPAGTIVDLDPRVADERNVAALVEPYVPAVAQAVAEPVASPVPDPVSVPVSAKRISAPEPTTSSD